jgi:hypothetical protein
MRRRAYYIVRSAASVISGSTLDREGLRRTLPSCMGSGSRADGYFNRRRRCAESMEWLMGIFASQSPRTAGL